MAVKKTDAAPKSDATAIEEDTHGVADPAPAVGLEEASGAIIEPGVTDAVDVSHESVDANPREGTTAAQNARLVANRNTLASIRKLKDGQGNYLWQPSFTEGQPQNVLAYPVTEMAAMPDVAPGAMPVAFGDFRRGYLIVDRTGVRVLRDPFTNKPYVHFYTTKRVGGGLLNPEMLRVLRMAAA